jgi:hypothetical protein
LSSGQHVPRPPDPRHHGSATDPRPDPAAADRPVVSVTTAPSGLEGEGFPVRRAFTGVDLCTLDPFVHLDQRGGRAGITVDDLPPLLRGFRAA